MHSAYVSLLLRGENCCYRYACLDGARMKQTYFKDIKVGQFIAISEKNSWHAPESNIGLLKPNYYEGNELAGSGITE